METNRYSVLAGVQGVNDMVKIRMVGAHWEGDDLSGIFLDIHFTNGQAVLLPLTGKAHDPAFTELLENKRIGRPKTDGDRVYWIDGPSLSCAEIQTLHLPRTDGGRVYWSNGASLSLDELMDMLTDETGSENKT